jgi:hypothetical protein
MHLRPAMELTSYVSSKCGYRLWASLIESQLFLISGCPALHWGAGVSSSGGSGTSLMPSGTLESSMSTSTSRRENSVTFIIRAGPAPKSKRLSLLRPRGCFRLQAASPGMGCKEPDLLRGGAK